MVFGQEVVFDGKLSDYDDGSKLSGVEVKAFANGAETYSTTSGRGGNYTVKLPLGKVYTIKYLKNGYVNKTMRIDVTGVNEEDLPIGGKIMPPVDIDLFTDREGVDFSFLNQEPVVTWEYDNRNLVMDWDRKVYNKMKTRIDELLAEAEKKKKEKDAEYNALIKEADNLFKNEEYEQALSKYEAALKIPGKQTESHPNNRLIEIEKILQEIAEKELEEKQGNQAYQNLLDAADNLASNKEFDKALDKYEEALKLKPGEQYPLDKIDEVLAAKKKDQDKKEYDELVKQGDNFFGQNSLQAARDKYTNALKLFPKESYPKEQLEKIQNKLDAEKEQREQKQKYDDAIAEADRLFDEEKYEQAVLKYQEAIKFEGAATYPKERIKIAEEKYAELLEQKRIKEEVEALVKEADILTNAKDYEEAIKKYDQALALSELSEIKAKKQKAVEKLDELQNKEKRAEQIDQLLASANESFEAGNLQDALNDFEAVLNLDTTNTAAIEGANKVKSAIKEKEKQEALQKEFDGLVEQADDLYSQEKWNEAEKMYEAAKKVIEDDNHVNDRLTSVREKIAENESLAEQEKQIQNLLDQAARQKSDKKWDDAIASYEKILTIKSDHQKTKTLLEETISMRDEWLANKEKQGKFDKLKGQADQLFSQKEWEEAKGKYLEAKEVQESNEVDQQLQIIEQELSKLSSAQEKEEKYNEAMGLAEGFEKSKEYQKAIDKYKDALAYKNNDSKAINKIDELEQKLKDIKEEKEKEEKYLAAVDKGNKAFEDEDFSAAIKFYDDGLEIKPMDSEALKLKNRAKVELDKLSSQEEQYQQLLSDAKDEKESGELKNAKKIYTQAQQMKPKDPVPQNAIVEIDELLRQREEAQAEQSEQDKLNRDYQNKIDLAEIAAQNLNYENAIDYLEEASEIKPEEEFPKKKIKEYKTLLTQIVDQNNKEQQYDDAIRKADDEFDNKSYDESIDFYKKALEIKENDDYAESQIKKAQAAISNIEDNSLNQEFNNIVAKANESFIKGEYESALSLYEKALDIKSDDTFAKDRRDETRQIIEDLANKDEENSRSEKEFKKLIIEADDLFENKRFIDAKDKYESALEIKSNDTYAIRKVQECIINAKEKINAGDEARYQKIIKKADEYFDEENYDKAISLYERALALRSYDQYPQEKIDEIKAILSKPEKKDVELEYLGEEVDISIVEAEAMFAAAENKRKSLKQDNVEKRIKKNEENFVSKTNEDLQERLDYQSEFVRINDDRSNNYTAEMQDRLDIATDIDDDMFSISKQRVQENKFERGSILRQNADLTYISDDYSLMHKEKSTAHLVNADKLDEINIKHDAQTIAESTDNRNDIQETNNKLEDVADNLREDSQRAVKMRKENEEGVYEIQNSKELRSFEESNNNYDKLQNLEDQATLAELKKHESSAEKAAINEQLNKDIVALEVKLKNKNAVEQRDVYESNLEVDAQLVKASDQYKESQANKDDARKQTVEDVKNIEAKSDEITIAQNQKESNDVQENIEYSESIKDLEKEGYIKMKDDLLALNEEVKTQEELLDRASRLKSDKENETRETTLNEIDLTEAKVASSRKGKDEKTKEIHESVKALEVSIDGGRQIKSEKEKKQKQNTQKYLEEVEEKDFNYTSEIANSLGDEYPEGVSQESFIIRDKNDLIVKITTRRIVVENGRGEVYLRIKNKSGTTYSKNGTPISEMAWIKGTENAKLEKHY